MVIFQYGEIRLTISVPSPSSRSQPVGPCSGPVIPAVWAKSYYNPLPPSSISTLPRFLVPSPPAPSFRQSVFAAVNGNRGEAEIAYKQRIITGGNLTGNQQQNPTPEENYKGDPPERLCPPELSVRQADLCARPWPSHQPPLLYGLSAY
ncbi:hypothetical protein CHARACLAT_004732 [Characodon lateralis]|uniref:Uncharacterized protein n=1 Tax=Characodon lateralis TaxID=208331 RepID=A0ABU7ES66_9TELE|nr:hypothetical protein [Characodon lateralis]